MANLDFLTFYDQIPRTSQTALVLHWSERWKKKEKEGKINLSFAFCPTIYLATLNVYTKFEDSGSHRS